jgi:putative membrane protein
MDGVPGNPDRPGLLKATASMTEGSARLATGTAALNAGIKGDPADPGNPGLLGGSEALAAGASELSEGNTKLASGSTQLATGAAKLAEGNAKIAAGTETLLSSAAAVSPSNVVGQPDDGTAVGMVGVLGLGSIGTFVALRQRRKAAAPQAEGS